MEDLDFSKILQDAENLTSEIEASTDLPRVQRNLRQVLEAGQLLLNRNNRFDATGVNTETQASVFLGTKGVDITRMSKKLEPLYKVVSGTDQHQIGSEADLDTYLKTERTNMITATVGATSKAFYNKLKTQIRSNMNNSWALEKEKILNALAGTTEPGSLIETQDNDYRSPVYNRRMESVSVLSKTELTFTHEIDVYNKCNIHNMPKPNLLEKFQTVAENTKDVHIKDLWDTVATMLTSIPVDSMPSVLERRTSPRWRKSMISKARTFLEQVYFMKLQEEVSRNLGRSMLGGVPAVIPMIKHYVALKNLAAIPGIEVGSGDVGPVWAIVYICLRSGKVNEAIKYMSERVGNQEFAGVLAEYSNYESMSGMLGLPQELEAQLRLEYRRVLKPSNRDPFKKLVYCLLGACDLLDDHGGVASRLDDYLWLKLSQVREASVESTRTSEFITYSEFQETILEKYGESHFDAFNKPYMYFQALFLTGQFEAAIDFLCRVSNLKSHGVHIAIVLNEMGLLITTDSKTKTLVHEKDDPEGIRRIGYVRLIVQYAKTFQGTNTKEALNYLYLLRNIKESPAGDTSLFSVCVSDLAMESRAYDLLFGTIMADGCRQPGVLEAMGFKIGPIVDHCASQAENSGMLEDAVVLYDLAGKADLALTILNRIISRQVNKKPLPDSPRQRIQHIALTLAERYQVNPPHITSKSTTACFYILVDFMTFFDEFHSRRTDNALSIIERMRVIPLRQDDIERCVANFHTYSDDIRLNIPDLIIATMEAIHLKFKKIKLERKGALVSGQSVDTQVNELKAKAKTLVTYCGLVPYFMTGDVYTKVMQIEVQIN